jgi:hypothetical protein
MIEDGERLVEAVGDGVRHIVPDALELKGFLHLGKRFAISFQFEAM